MRSSLRAHVLVALATCVAILGLGAVAALASTASEEQQGAALVKALKAGDRSCSTLSADNFERIGEYAMGLNFITAAQHSAMNRHMRSMMGSQGEELAHQAMGRAYAGCATSGRSVGAYGMGMMGGYGASGMMNGNAYGTGMMGRNGGHHDWSTGAVIAIAALSAALAGALVAFLVTRSGRRSPTDATS